MLGGAGNVVRNLVSLGVQAQFISVVGSDQAGNDVMRLVGDSGNLEPHLLVDRQRPTTIKTRFVADGHQLLRADTESTAPLSAETARDFERVVGEAVRDCDIVVPDLNASRRHAEVHLDGGDVWLVDLDSTPHSSRILAAFTT